MALLAGPKRKQKLGIDPNNTNWIKDTSAIGQSLLKKMGWKEGAGLGANENGRVIPVKASLKMDNRGLGCSPQQADAWIAHQEEFDQILASLNSSATSENCANSVSVNDSPNPNEKLQDGQRRFYGRFSRGGVKTLRTTEDLNSILGRKKSSTPTENKTKEETISPNELEEPKNDIHVDKSHGFVTVTSSCSVQDYFKQKLKNRKLPPSLQKKNEELEGNNDTSLSTKEQTEMRKESFQTSNCTVQDYFAQKMKAKKEKLAAETEVPLTSVKDDEQDKAERKKRKKELKNDKGIGRGRNPSDEEVTETNSKKEKVDVTELDRDVNDMELNSIDNSISQINDKQLSSEIVIDCEISQVTRKSKKGKKRKKLNQSEENECIDLTESLIIVEDEKSDPQHIKSNDRTVINVDQLEDLDENQVNSNSAQSVLETELDCLLTGTTQASTELALDCKLSQSTRKSKKGEKKRKLNQKHDVKSDIQTNGLLIVENELGEIEQACQSTNATKEKEKKKSFKLSEMDRSLNENTIPKQVVQSNIKDKKCKIKADINVIATSDKKAKKKINYKKKKMIVGHLEMLQDVESTKQLNKILSKKHAVSYDGFLPDMERKLKKKLLIKVSLQKENLEENEPKKKEKLDKKILKVKEATFDKAKAINQLIIEELQNEEIRVMKKVKRQIKKRISNIKTMAQNQGDALDVNWQNEIALLKTTKDNIFSDVKKVRQEVEESLNKKLNGLIQKFEEIEKNALLNIETDITSKDKSTLFPGSSIIKGYLYD